MEEKQNPGLIPEGCEQCPNNKERSDYRKAGKFGSYSFALLLTFMLVAFSFQHKEHGWEPKDEPPIAVWALFLPIIGACLGVQIDLETVGQGVTALLSAVKTKDD